jgi:glyoxylase-like metal-dependent hydrolase (beta-lactamase superfamily II)
MNIAEGVDALEMRMRFAGGDMLAWPVLFRDAGGDATLVDAGHAGHEAAFLDAIARAGVDPARPRRIILTHQDLDHIGSAPGIAAATGALVLAHAGDAPYIDGRLRPIKLDPARWAERLARCPAAERPAVERVLADPPRVPVGRLLVDGERLPWHGGIRVIHTPGHTPGHVSLYHEPSRLLIAGDALRTEEGVLVGPSPAATLDMPRALASLGKLLALDIDRVVCYHGGLAGPGSAARLRALAG